MRISDWSSDVCSSDLGYVAGAAPAMPGRLVAERNGRRMGPLEQTGRAVGRGDASLAKGLAPMLATEQGHDRGLAFEARFFYIITQGLISYCTRTRHLIIGDKTPGAKTAP